MIKHHWTDLSAEEKIDRMAEAIFNLSKKVDVLMEHTNADVKPGYSIQRPEMTHEAADYWLGVFPHVRKKDA